MRFLSQNSLQFPIVHLSKNAGIVPVSNCLDHYDAVVIHLFLICPEYWMRHVCKCGFDEIKKIISIFFSHIKTCTTLHCQSLRWRQKHQYSLSRQSPGVSKTNSYLRITPNTLPKVLKLFNLGILTCCRIPYLWGYEVRNTCEARVQLLLSLKITIEIWLKYLIR